MSREHDERLVTAFERIAAALERLAEFAAPAILIDTNIDKVTDNVI